MRTNSGAILLALSTFFITPRAQAGQHIGMDFDFGRLSTSTGMLEETVGVVGFSGGVMGFGLDIRTFGDDDPYGLNPRFRAVLDGHVGRKLLGYDSTGNLLEENPRNVDDPYVDPMFSFIQFSVELHASPWSLEHGDFSFTPSVGLVYGMTIYSYEFALAPIDPEAYDEDSYLFADSYSDSLGPALGSWVRWKKFQGYGEVSLLALGPLMGNAVGTSPQAIGVVNGEGVTGSIGQHEGPLVSGKVKVSWDGIRPVIPSLSAEVQRWAVNTDRDTRVYNDSFVTTHGMIYASLGLYIGAPKIQ